MNIDLNYQSQAMTGEASGQDAKFEGQHAGVVSRYFDKIQVAAIDCSAPVKIGDVIRFYTKQGEVVSEMTVQSMQIEHAQVQEAKAGDQVGMKVEGDVKEGHLVYKIE